MRRAPYIGFNGAVRSLAGDKALQARVGETVRIYFGVGGPNVTSSFRMVAPPRPGRSWWRPDFAWRTATSSNPSNAA